MKGIILAGGLGTRLYPLTNAVSKQLLPVYDKPMIYYPLSILMLAGIKDILLIATPEELPRFKRLFGDGSNWGINLAYQKQIKPEGIAQAFIIGKNFIGRDNVCLILGDNLFYGHGLTQKLQRAAELKTGCTLFAYKVNNPKRYGVISFDSSGKAVSIEEKPETPKSDFAVTGLYFYDNRVIKFAEELKPSQRNELEITDINRLYLMEKSIKVELLGRGCAWFDTGTCDSLLEASCFIETIEKRQGLKIACLEEIAWRMGFLSKEEIINKLQAKKGHPYHNYVIDILEKGFINEDL